MKRSGFKNPDEKKAKRKTSFGSVTVRRPQLQRQLAPLPLAPPPRVEPYDESDYDGWDDYYAFASKIQPVSQTLVEIKFECVSCLWFFFSALNNQPEAYYKAYKVVPTSIVMAQAVLVQAQAQPPEGPLNLPGEPLIGGQGLTLQVTAQPIQEGQWYRLRLGGRINGAPIIPGPPPANGRDPQLVTFTPKGFQYGTTRLRDLRSVADASVQDRQTLENYFSISHMIEEEAAYDNPALAFVGMLNVGQGSCCALYDYTGRPFLYHDFGRALSSHERPQPPPLTACLSGSPTIILSHLDGDHYEMVYDVPGAFGVPWIIPEPPGGIVGPDIWGFVNRVAHKRMWPHVNKAFEEYDWGFILKGTSEQPGSHGKNNAGLVALVRVKNDTNAPPVGQRKALDTEGRRPQIFPDERYVLLTADVPCGYIESLAYHDLDGKLVAMTAPHHGAETDLNWSFLPVPAAPIHGLPPVIGYTYGIRSDDGTNSFGHPRGEALTQLAARGFHHRVNTMTARNGAPVGGVAHAYAHQASCALYARLQGAHPGALSVAGQAATAAMNTYTLQRTAALQSLHNSAAAYAAFMAAKRTAANGASTIPNVDAAALAAFNQEHGINATTIQAAFNVVQGTAAATKPLTVTKYQNYWNPLWQTAVTDATQAQTDALTVAQTAVQTPRPQRTRCDGAGSLALPAPGGGVLNIEQTPYNTPVVGLIPFNEAVNITGAAPDSTVTHNNHRLRTGDYITISIAAVNAGYQGRTVQVTVATANTYTIPVGANGQDENGIQVSGYRVAREGKFVEAVNIAGGNPNSTIAHNNHGLKTGDVISVVQAVNVAFQNQTHPITYVDANSYTVPINAAGQNENGVQITGFRLAGSFAETVTIAGGNPNSTITHNNHRLQTGDNITFANTVAVPAQFQGQIVAITRIDGNSYRVAVNAAGVNANNVPVSGVRSGRGQVITPIRWNFDRTISLVGGNNTATVTCNNHNLRTGDTITIDPGSTAVNAVYQNQAVAITRTDDNTFTIPIGNNGQNENNIPARGSIPTRWYFDATVSIVGGGGIATVTRRDHNLRTGETITIDPSSASPHAVYRNQAVVVTRLDENRFTIPIGNNGQNANVRAVGVNPVQTRHGIIRPSNPELQATLVADYIPFTTVTKLGNCDAGHTTFQSLVRHN